MPDEHIMKMKITRLLFFRLSAQKYCRLGNLIGPFITCIKALSSRSCVTELEVDLEERNPDFVQWARVFIKSLKRIKEIQPFRRCWVPQKGLGSSKYALSSKEGEKVEKALCIANGRLCKRNIVAHEVLAELLGAEDLNRILQPLLFDHGDSALHFYFKSDTLCSMAMMNPQITLKNTLLDNGING